jgi:hypothetical protein
MQLMKRIEVNTPNSVMQLFEVVAIENRPIMVGDYVLRKEVWSTLGSDGRYKYGEYRSKAHFDRMDNRVGRLYSSNYTDSWSIGQRNEKIVENCVAIRFVDERLNDYYGVNKN